MERGNDHAKREAREQVPNDRVKDAPALARELRWRVRLARGESSDDEEVDADDEGVLVDGEDIGPESVARQEH